MGVWRLVFVRVFFLSPFAFRFIFFMFFFFLLYVCSAVLGMVLGTVRPTDGRCLLRNAYSRLIFTATRELARRPRDYFLLGGILGIFLRVVYGRCELLRGPSSAAPPASDGYGPGTPQLSSSANFHADTQQFIAGAPELLAAGGRTA